MTLSLRPKTAFATALVAIGLLSTAAANAQLTWDWHYSGASRR